MPGTRKDNFYTILGAAISDLSEHGFDSEDRVAYWSQRLKEASAELFAHNRFETHLKDALQSIYRKMVERGEISKYHYGVSRFTIQSLEPKLRQELNRRIYAATDLIKLWREQAVADTLSRFQGWATSVPPGGTKATEKKAVKTGIYKTLSQLDFVDRRCRIDQGYKLVSSINSIIAEDGGALAGIWHSHGKHDASYDARPEHLKRDGKVFAIRDSWAIKQGLMKVGTAGYTDQQTQPGEETYCRCAFQYLYNLTDLPTDMLTAKGKAFVAQARTIARGFKQ